MGTKLEPLFYDLNENNVEAIYMLFSGAEMGRIVHTSTGM